jgi:hypothetical protein
MPLMKAVSASLRAVIAAPAAPAWQTAERLLRLDPVITIALHRAPAAPRSSEGGKRCALYLA